MTWSALDLRVFILINGVMGCLMALVLYSQSRSYPKSIHGLREWATAYLLAFFATVLYGLQNTLHPLITVGLANVLLLLTGAYALAGAAAFCRAGYFRHCCAFRCRHLPGSVPTAPITTTV